MVVFIAGLLRVSVFCWISPMRNSRVTDPKAEAKGPCHCYILGVHSPVSMDIIRGNLDLPQMCLRRPVCYQHFQPYSPRSKSFDINFLICTVGLLAPGMEAMIRSMDSKKASYQPRGLIVDSGLSHTQ